MVKKSSRPSDVRGTGSPSAPMPQTMNRHLPVRGSVAQSKPAASQSRAERNPTPAARPALKAAQGPALPARTPPVAAAKRAPRAPDAYRPQPVPKCLQMKAAARPQTPAGRMKPAGLTPNAPPTVPPPKVLQPMMAQAKGAAPPRSGARRSTTIQLMPVDAGWVTIPDQFSGVNRVGINGNTEYIFSFRHEDVRYHLSVVPNGRPPDQGVHVKFDIPDLNPDPNDWMPPQVFSVTFDFGTAYHRHPIRTRGTYQGLPQQRLQLARESAESMAARFFHQVGLLALDRFAQDFQNF